MVGEKKRAAFWADVDAELSRQEPGTHRVLLEKNTKNAAFLST